MRPLLTLHLLYGTLHREDATGKRRKTKREWDITPSQSAALVDSEVVLELRLCDSLQSY